MGRAEPSITVAAARSSSTVQHELRCFSRLRRSPAFTWREVMRIVVLRESSVPGRASRRRRSVHVSHSCFAGLQHRSRSGSQLPVEMPVLPFCSSHWNSQVTPELLSPIYSRSVPARSGCVRCPLVPDRQRHHSLEGTINLIARRSIRHSSASTSRSNHPSQPAAPSSRRLSRFRPLVLFVRLPSVPADRVVMQASEKLHNFGLMHRSKLRSRIANRVRRFLHWQWPPSRAWGARQKTPAVAAKLLSGFWG